MAPPVFCLSYFPFHGRALPIRLAATLNGLRWEDRLIKRDKFLQDKLFTEYSKYAPRWIGLPEVTFYRDPSPQITVGQSIGLLRYIGQLGSENKPHDLYPSENKMDCLLIDELLYADEEMIKLLTNAFMEQDPDTKLKLTAELTVPTPNDPKRLQYFMGRFEDRLRENKVRGNNNGFFVGDGLTIADLQFFSIVSILHPETKSLHQISWDGFDYSFFKGYKSCYEHVLRVADNPTIKAFIDSFNEDAAQFMKDAEKQETVIPRGRPRKEKKQKKLKTKSDA